ncbi:MAG: chromosomal replication initiator protein DnaA, partial [Runella slithyformis]
LKNIVTSHDREVNMDTIQEMIADYFDVSISDLKSKSRKKELVYPRQMAMYFAKELTPLPLKSIGYHFGGRDHSTVIHAIQTINDLITQDEVVNEAVQKLRSNFGR